MRLFRNDLEAIFVRRHNRFLVEVREDGERDTGGGAGRRLLAHLANSGKLAELLVPGTPLILEHAQRKPANRVRPKRKTEWTAVAVRYKGKIIPLVSVRANSAAEELLIPRLFPSAQEIRSEYSEGGSRFDFFIRDEAGEHYIEVKSCTLCEEGRAMFPDAPTDRGKRHVEHLAELAGSPGTHGHLLFVLHHEDATHFSPHIHTDPAFSLALAEAAQKIHIRAISLRCGSDGEGGIASADLPIDLSPVAHVRADRGAYLLILRFDAERRVEVGALGGLDLRRGYYVYAGSARGGLARRVARHLRRGKRKLRWHIDYLTESSEKTEAYPVYNGGDIECEMAAGLEEIGGEAVAGFGSSDCACGSHLFRFSTYPRHLRSFNDLLLHYRHYIRG